MDKNNSNLVKQEPNRLGKGGFGDHPENINREGRPPKGLAVTDVIRAIMDEKPEIKKALGTKLLEMALNGDMAAIREVMDRLEGRPVQRQELTGAEGESLLPRINMNDEEIKEFIKIRDDIRRRRITSPVSSRPKEVGSGMDSPEQDSE